MKKSTVPISNCHSRCKRCGLPSAFQYFESGPGGDFATYLGAGTGTTYRVECMYGSIDAAERKIAELEGSPSHVMRIPASIRCKLCGGPLDSDTIAVDGETQVEAVLL